MVTYSISESSPHLEVEGSPPLPTSFARLGPRISGPSTFGGTILQDMHIFESSARSDDSDDHDSEAWSSPRFNYNRLVQIDNDDDPTITSFLHSYTQAHLDESDSPSIPSTLTKSHAAEVHTGAEVVTAYLLTHFHDHLSHPQGDLERTTAGNWGGGNNDSGGSRGSSGRMSDNASPLTITSPTTATVCITQHVPYGRSASGKVLKKILTYTLSLTYYPSDNILAFETDDSGPVPPASSSDSFTTSSDSAAVSAPISVRGNFQCEPLPADPAMSNTCLLKCTCEMELWSETGGVDSADQTLLQRGLKSMKSMKAMTQGAGIMKSPSPTPVAPQINDSLKSIYPMTSQPPKTATQLSPTPSLPSKSGVRATITRLTTTRFSVDGAPQQLRVADAHAIIDCVCAAVPAMHKLYQRYDEVDELTYKHFADIVCAAPPPPTDAESAFIGSCVELVPEMYDEIIWKRVASTLLSPVAVFSHLENPDFTKIIATIDTSAARLLAWLYEFKSNERINAHIEHHGVTFREELISASGHSKYTSKYSVTPVGADDRIHSNWLAWSRLPRGDLVLAFGELPASSNGITSESAALAEFKATIQNQCVASQATSASSKGFYRIKELAPNVCEVSLVNVFSGAANAASTAGRAVHQGSYYTPEYFLKSSKADDLNTFKHLHVKYLRNGRAVDLEIRANFAAPPPVARLLVAQRQILLRSQALENDGNKLTSVRLRSARKLVKGGFGSSVTDDGWIQLAPSSPFITSWVKFDEGENHVERTTAVVDCPAPEAAAWFFDVTGRERTRVSRERGDLMRISHDESEVGRLHKHGHRLGMDATVSEIRKMPFPRKPREFTYRCFSAVDTGGHILVPVESAKWHNAVLSRGREFDTVEGDILGLLRVEPVNCEQCKVTYSIRITNPAPNMTSFDMVAAMRSAFQKDGTVDTAEHVKLQNLLLKSRPLDTVRATLRLKQELAVVRRPSDLLREDSLNKESKYRSGKFFTSLLADDGPLADVIVGRRHVKPSTRFKDRRPSEHEKLARADISYDEKAIVGHLQTKYGSIDDEAFEHINSNDSLIMCGVIHVVNEASQSDGASRFSTKTIQRVLATDTAQNESVLGVGRASCVVDASIVQCAAFELSKMDRRHVLRHFQEHGRNVDYALDTVSRHTSVFRRLCRYEGVVNGLLKAREYVTRQIWKWEDAKTFVVAYKFAEEAGEDLDAYPVREEYHRAREQGLLRFDELDDVGFVKQTRVTWTLWSDSGELLLPYQVTKRLENELGTLSAMRLHFDSSLTVDLMRRRELERIVESRKNCRTKKRFTALKAESRRAITRGSSQRTTTAGVGEDDVTYSEEEKRSFATGLSYFDVHKNNPRKKLPSLSRSVKSEIAFEGGSKDHDAWARSECFVRAKKEEVLAYVFIQDARCRFEVADTERVVLEKKSDHRHIMYEATRGLNYGGIEVRARDFVTECMWRPQLDGSIQVVGIPSRHSAMPESKRGGRRAVLGTRKLATTRMLAVTPILPTAGGDPPSTSTSISNSSKWNNVVKQIAQESRVRATKPWCVLLKEVSPGLTKMTVVTSIKMGGRVVAPIMRQLLVSKVDLTAKAQQYFQEERALNEYDENDGQALGLTLVYFGFKDKKKYGSGIERIRRLVDSHAGLRELSEKCPWLVPFLDRVVRGRLSRNHSVDTKLVCLSDKEAVQIAANLSPALRQRKSADAGLYQWKLQNKSMIELFEIYPWTESMMLSIGQEVLKFAPWGLMFRVCTGAGLSIFDLATDVVMIVNYMKQEDGLQFAYLLLFMVLLSMSLQIVVVWAQNRTKPWDMLREALWVVSGLKPGVDAMRVSSGKKLEAHHLVDRKVELYVTKLIETFAESIPGGVLQMYALMKLMRTNKMDTVAMVSIISSALTTGFTSSQTSYDFDTDPARRRQSPEFYGFVPDSSRPRLAMLVSMTTMSALMLLLRSCSAAALLTIDKRIWFGLFFGEIAVYFVYCAARDDFIYWVRADKRFSWLLSGIARFVIKVVTDFTGLVYFRASIEVGGLFYTVTQLWGIATTYVAVHLYTQFVCVPSLCEKVHLELNLFLCARVDPDATIPSELGERGETQPLSLCAAKLKPEQYCLMGAFTATVECPEVRWEAVFASSAWTAVSAMSAAYLLAAFVFLKFMVKEYRRSFFSPMTGRQYVQNLFLNSNDDKTRSTIFQYNRELIRNIEVDVKQWVHQKWHSWEDLAPEWFTPNFIASVPADMIPAENMDDMIKKGAGARRSGPSQKQLKESERSLLLHSTRFIEKVVMPQD